MNILVSFTIGNHHFSTANLYAHAVQFLKASLLGLAQRSLGNTPILMDKRFHYFKIERSELGGLGACPN